jgi:hypothetical protein
MQKKNEERKPGAKTSECTRQEDDARKPAVKKSTPHAQLQMGKPQPREVTQI